MADSEQNKLYLSIFGGIDVFAAPRLASDPPTPVLTPGSPASMEESGLDVNPNGNLVDESEYFLLGCGSTQLVHESYSSP